MAEIIHLDPKNFDKVCKNPGTIVLLDFFATWCGPCKIMAKILEEYAPQAPESVIIAKVDVGEADELAATFGITSIPTIVILKDGNNVYQRAGVHEKQELIDLVEKFK